MSSFGRGIAANFVARAWVVVVLVLMTPAYLELLGVEAYGLIGAFTAVQTIVAIFDLGLGLTLNRQLAKLDLADPAARQHARDTVRTFETVYWGIGAAIAAAIIASSSSIATAWLHASGISQQEMIVALALMGVAIGTQWPSALYSGGLLGLRRQFSASLIVSAMATLRGFGAVAILRFVSPTIEAFFIWQTCISLLQTLVLRAALARALPNATREDRFRAGILREHFRFAAHLAAITVLATLLTQTDKVLLSSLVSLEAFGYYALAGTIASGLYIFVQPVFNAAFPRLVSEVSAGSEQLSRTYHKSCALLSVLVLPPAVILIVFAPEVLSGWLGTNFYTDATAAPLRLLAAGTALNGLMNMPYALMLASGWTRLPLVLNACALIILAPLIVILTNRFGTVGGASAWLLLNTAYVAVGVPVMHAGVLRGHALRWYLADVGLPLTSAFAVALAVRGITSEPTDRGGTLFLLGGAAVATYVASALGVAPVRERIRHVFGQRVDPSEPSPIQR